MKVLWMTGAVVFGALMLLGLAMCWTALIYFLRDYKIMKRIKKLLGMW